MKISRLPGERAMRDPLPGAVAILTFGPRSRSSCISGRSDCFVSRQGAGGIVHWVRQVVLDRDPRLACIPSTFLDVPIEAPFYQR
jgi:hypothetical protein